MQLDPGMLTRLRAFEGVGRLRSFTQAAQELYVTPAALSHHVRHLEQALGVQLVIRMHRRIDPTVDTGDHYYLTWPQGRPMRPKLATFSHWLRDEIRKQPHA